MSFVNYGHLNYHKQFKIIIFISQYRKHNNTVTDAADKTDRYPFKFQALRTTGIRKNDARVKEVMHNLYKVHKEQNFEGGSPETLKLDRKTFKEVIAPNIVLITRAFRSQFVIPDFQDFIKDIEEMYWSAKSNTDGKVASYIPQLARASSECWGVSVCTIDGQRFSIGKLVILHVYLFPLFLHDVF